MPIEVLEKTHIVQDEGICGGQPRIAGTRIKVQGIAVEYERLGWTADQVCEAHPNLTLADVHAAIAYYYDHKHEIDEAIRKDEEFVEKMKKKLS